MQLFNTIAEYHAMDESSLAVEARFEIWESTVRFLVRLMTSPAVAIEGNRPTIYKRFAYPRTSPMPSLHLEYYKLKCCVDQAKVNAPNV